MRWIALGSRLGFRTRTHTARSTKKSLDLCKHLIGVKSCQGTWIVKFLNMWNKQNSLYVRQTSY